MVGDYQPEGVGKKKRGEGGGSGGFGGDGSIREDFLDNDAALG
jgi:hypothetical protein